MPQARKSARSSSRTSATFKEPAALKRLNSSLDSAQKALKDLQTQAGRNAAASTKALHKGLGKFLSDARRDSGKFTTALKRDFEAAQKAAKSAQASATSTARRATGRSSSTRASGTRATASRSGGSKSAGSKSAGSKSTASKSTASKSGGSRTRASGSRSTRKSS
jgi:DNA topoisomerase-1